MFLSWGPRLSCWSRIPVRRFFVVIFVVACRGYWGPYLLHKCLRDIVMLKLSRDSIRLCFCRGHFWVTRSSWCELWTTGLVEGKIETGNHWVSPSNIEISGQFCLQPIPWWMAGKGTLGCWSFFGAGTRWWFQCGDLTMNPRLRGHRFGGFLLVFWRKREQLSWKQWIFKGHESNFWVLHQAICDRRTISGLWKWPFCSLWGRCSVFASGRRGSGSSGVMSPVSCPNNCWCLGGHEMIQWWMVMDWIIPIHSLRLLHQEDGSLVCFLR
jgi:hypothetical protein